jgi:hypothetical protein
LPRSSRFLRHAFRGELASVPHATRGNFDGGSVAIGVGIPSRASMNG